MPRLSDPNRRYAWATLGVAAAGVGLLVYFVSWSGDAIAELQQSNLETRARHAGTAYREKLTKALRARDPVAVGTWEALVPDLEDALQSLPYLVGIVIRLPSGRLGGVIGPLKELSRAPFVPPPGARGEMTVELGPENGDQRRAVAAFLVPPDADGEGGARVNVHLQFSSLASLDTVFLARLRVGTIIVGLIIYLLAVLASIVSRRSISLANRERERGVRLRAIGDVAGGIAHELRNPLNAINLSVQLIERAMRDTAAEGKNRTRDFERVYGEIGKIKKVVDNFVRFARLGDLTITSFDLAETVKVALTALGPVLTDARIQADFQAEGPTTLLGDQEKLSQVVAATLQNAVDAMTNGGELTIRLLGRRSDLRLSIRDTGEVMDEARLRSIFEPYYSARDHALGLGMTIAKTYVECHGGVVDAGAALGGGCVVTITLPRRFA